MWAHLSCVEVMGGPTFLLCDCVLSLKHAAAAKFVNYVLFIFLKTGNVVNYALSKI